MKLTQRVNRIKPSPTLVITAKAKALKSQGIDVVGFGAGEPDFDTPVHIKQAAIKAIDSGFTKYTDTPGIVELKDAIIAKLKNDNQLDYSRDQIIVSNGGKHVLYNIAQVLFESGDEVIIPAPYWVSYPDQVLLNDATPVFISTTEQNGFKVTPEELKKAITPKTKAFVLNSPSNPTGAGYSEQDIRALASVLEEHSIYCISDEIYEKIVYGDFKHFSIAQCSAKMKDLTLVVNGVSKAYSMTGWRMGFAAGPKEIIAAMNKVQGQVTSNICSITQKACVEAYVGPQDFLKDMVVQFQKRRDYIVAELNSLPGIKCPNPEGAFYVFPNIKGLLGKKTNKGLVIANASQFADYLLEEYQVAVVSGEGFGAEGYMRLSYATSMEEIKKGLERIKKAVLALS
jgi:aspartate aminotransferase